MQAAGLHTLGMENLWDMKLPSMGVEDHKSYVKWTVFLKRVKSLNTTLTVHNQILLLSNISSLFSEIQLFEICNE